MNARPLVDRVAGKRRREAAEMEATSLRLARIQVIREAMLAFRKPEHGGFNVSWEQAQERAISAVSDLEAAERQ
jgi:hypothetical protein